MATMEIHVGGFPTCVGIKAVPYNLTNALQALTDQAKILGFDASCDPVVGQLLTTLVASKPAGRFLELGTGVGMGTYFLLSGMDKDSLLDSVELDAALSEVASRTLADKRVNFFVTDGEKWLNDHQSQRYDLIFADTWPGKFYALEDALALLAPGGIYLIDDLSPQPNWPQGHQAKVDHLRQMLEARADLHCTQLDWGTGLMICVKRGE